MTFLILSYQIDFEAQKKAKEAAERARRERKEWDRDCSKSGGGRNALSAPQPLNVDEGENHATFLKLLQRICNYITFRNTVSPPLIDAMVEAVSSGFRPLSPVHGSVRTGPLNLDQHMRR